MLGSISFYANSALTSFYTVPAPYGHLRRSGIEPLRDAGAERGEEIDLLARFTPRLSVSKPCGRHRRLKGSKEPVHLRRYLYRARRARGEIIHRWRKVKN